MSNQKSTAEGPNIRAAIGHALLTAADLIGKEPVVEFFRGLVGDIISNHFPIDAGGLINAKCRDDAAIEINKLLNE
jgi:hypothetical protein